MKKMLVFASLVIVFSGTAFAAATIDLTGIPARGESAPVVVAQVSGLDPGQFASYGGIFFHQIDKNYGTTPPNIKWVVAPNYDTILPIAPDGTITCVLNTGQPDVWGLAVAVFLVPVGTDVVDCGYVGAYPGAIECPELPSQPGAIASDQAARPEPGMPTITISAVPEQGQGGLLVGNVTPHEVDDFIIVYFKGSDGVWSLSKRPASKLNGEGDFTARVDDPDVIEVAVFVLVGGSLTPNEFYDHKPLYTEVLGALTGAYAEALAQVASLSVPFFTDTTK